jgi:nicotinamide-nucleotide amidase
MSQPPRPIRTAAIVAVGSELLTPAKVDTNSLVITEQLNTVGIAVRLKAVVGDSPGDLQATLRKLLGRVDLVVISGGLGPTDDDVTREAVAATLGRTLHEDAGLVERLRQRFVRRGLEMPAINRRQAMVPDGAEILPNVNGTAPGLWLEHQGRVVIMLPGPPRELRPMIEALVTERLAARASGDRLYMGVLRVTGQTESHAEEMARPLYAQWRARGWPIEETTLASPGSIDFHVTVRAADDVTGARLLNETLSELAGVFGEDAYSDDGRPMEQVVAGLLAAGRHTVAAAESCTGGLLTSRLTDVPGSSGYVLSSVVAYSNEAKVALLGVPESLIVQHGAVSEPVALAMASGIRAATGATIGIGVTGIAGPAGGTPEKPVGTVAIAVDGPWGHQVRTRTFLGDRAMVKFFATQAALDDVRRALLRDRTRSGRDR